MNILQRGIAYLAGLPVPEAPRDPMDARFWGGLTTQSMAGQAVTADSAAQLDVVQAVLERLAGTISTLPMMVYRRTGEDEREPARDHPLFNLLRRTPNARQTAQEFRDEQQRHLSFYRNCYSEIIPAPDGSPIGSLEPIHPARVLKIERKGGRIFYTIRNLEGGGQSVIEEDRIWHIRKAPLTPDGLMGRPMYDTARETFGKAQAVEQFGALYFANGGSGGGVLKHPGAFKDKQQQADFLDAWRAGGSGLSRHRDRLLLNGVDYTPFAINNDEAQFIETTREMGSKLARLWSMPPHMVGILDKATFSNIEQQSIEYVVHTLAPWISAWEQAAARDLLIGKDQDEYFVEFNVAGLLRGDFKTRWASYALGRQWGWLSINDVRRLENMKAIGPEGDDYLQPLNMVPAGSEDDASETEDQADPAENGAPAQPGGKPTGPNNDP